MGDYKLSCTFDVISSLKFSHNDTVGDRSLFTEGLVQKSRDENKWLHLGGRRKAKFQL